MGPGDLQALALELLSACGEALDTIPSYEPTLAGAPSRTFISPGRPALEGCEQLCVHIDSVLDADTNPGGLAAGRRNVTGKLNHVRLVATVDRCVYDTRTGTDMTIPTKPEDLEQTAAQTNADGWALWNHIFNLWRSGALFTLCGEVFFEGLRALPEEGGRAGWTLTLRVTLGGYEEFGT
jgi:hypothetical protein